MADKMIEMIPDARRDGVRTALRTAFGSAPAEAALDGAARPIAGGVSGALILRFEVGGRPYVLRLEPERIAFDHRARGFACMASAAEAGAAPPVRYADAASGVAIMDFVASRPLSEHPGGLEGLTRALGELTARVRAAPPFPSLGDYPQVIADLLAGLDRSGLLAPGLLRPHAEGLARIRGALPWKAAALVSSHNDPNPRNLLFDGERLWLIDWELATLNDPLVDLAILTTELAQTPELEDILLEATFGWAPDQPLRDRLSVMRLLTRLFYGCIVLDSFSGGARSGLDASLAAFTPSGFRAAVIEGRLASGAPETAYAFAKMSLAAFLDGVTAPGFDAVLQRVSQG